MESLSDEELVARYRAEIDPRRGNAYIGQLFQRHHRRVAAWCLRMAGDVDSATELAQEVFLKAFESLPSFGADARFTPWLYAIVRNHCIYKLRSGAAQTEDDTDASIDQDLSPAMDRPESEDLVKRLIRESLDETETQVMTLHYVHELPSGSVTRILGLGNQSGKASVVSARRKLNRALTRWNKRQERIRESDHAGS